MTISKFFFNLIVIKFSYKPKCLESYACLIEIE